MELKFSNKITELAEKLNKPLYAVGGYVRNYLIDKSYSSDVDLCAPIRQEELLPILNELGFEIKCEYKRTGTIVFCDEENRYEYTCFRKESYEKGGYHTPIETSFTENILEDSLRRDFKCNAVYYDIKNKQIVDVLGGVSDIENKVLSTVDSPEKVFCHDGLRLLRLARFAGELNFTPTDDTLKGAKEFASNIKDIAKERIYEELKKILISDTKYSFSDKYGHYNGLKILDNTRVLDYIFPELTLGRDMKQRSDFHNHTVLEHSLRAVKYSDKSIRLSALLHDVGKPYCMQKNGKYFGHDKEGERLSTVALERLKADSKAIKEVAFLTATHMVDLKNDMSENKVKLFIINNYSMIDKFFFLKQADFSACKDDLSISPIVEKWKKILQKMKDQKLPFCIKGLNIKASDLLAINIEPKRINETLKYLQRKVVLGELKNEKEELLLAIKKQD